MIKNNHTTTKSLRATIQGPKDKEPRQRTTIQGSKDKEQPYNDQKTKNNHTVTKRQRTTIQ